VLQFGVASLFAHIWEVSSDTILHCYCIDEELEKSTGGTGAIHSSEKLKSALEKSEKHQEAKRKTLNSSFV